MPGNAAAPAGENELLPEQYRVLPV